MLPKLHPDKIMPPIVSSASSLYLQSPVLEQKATIQMDDLYQLNPLSQYPLHLKIACQMPV